MVAAYLLIQATVAASGAAVDHTLGDGTFLKTTHAQVAVSSHGQLQQSDAAAAGKQNVEQPASRPRTSRALFRRPDGLTDDPSADAQYAPVDRSLDRAAFLEAKADEANGQDDDDEDAATDSLSLAPGASSMIELEVDALASDQAQQTSARRRRRFSMAAAYSYDFNGTFYDDIVDMTSGTLFGPFSVEFKARWDAFNRWSRILDFGEGPRSDNIIISQSANPGELAFYTYSGTKSKGFTIPGALELGVMSSFLLTLSEFGHMRVWKDGKMIGEFEDAFVPRRIDRSHFYVGKSNWENTPLFKGTIQDLYIWSGEATKWGARDSGGD